MFKGYYVPSGYMGWVSNGLASGSYILFASEADYMDYVKELIDEGSN